jgi:hybrid cluster-associated redox disulfide protein
MITKDMKIEEVLQKYPETMEVFMTNGFHCLGCAASSFENIEDGAAVHSIDVDKFVAELNKAIEKK